VDLFVKGALGLEISKTKSIEITIILFLEGVMYICDSKKTKTVHKCVYGIHNNHDHIDEGKKVKGDRGWEKGEGGRMERGGRK
jgi:hypothetical protein